MPDIKTTEETTRSSIDGTELVRLATTGANWKATLSAIKTYISSTIVSGVSSVASKTGAVTLDQDDITGFIGEKKLSHAAILFAALPSAAANPGGIVRISDCNTTRLGYPAAGGGSNTLQVQSDGTIWRVFGSPTGRRVACGNILFFISTSGNDVTGDGQQTSPFATLDRAWTEVVGTGTGAGIDSNGFQITFALEDGVHTYASYPALFIGQDWGGGGELHIQSVSGNAANCTILGPYNGEGVAIDVSAHIATKLVVQNLTFEGWHSNVFCDFYGGGVIWCQNLIHGEGAIPNHIECASPSGHIIVFGTDKIIGSQANSHLFARQGGRIHYFCSTATIAPPNSPPLLTIAAGWCSTQDANSCIDFEPPAFTGNYSGRRWVLTSNSTLAIWGNGNWTPGSPETAIPGITTDPDTLSSGSKLLYATNANVYERMHGRNSLIARRFTGFYSNDFFWTELTGYRESGFSDLIETYSLALPKAQGAPGAHLENDGTGQLSWVDGRLVAANDLSFYVSRFTGTTVGGSGYTNGSYDNVVLTGGTGIGATANIVVEGNAVTLVKPRSQGTGYAIGNVLSCASLGPGTAFTFTITHIGDDSDSNTGQLATTPFATLTRALAEANKYNFQGLYNFGIYPENGFYDEGANIIFPSTVSMNCGGGLPAIVGHTPRPESIEFYTSSDVFLFASGGSFTCWGLRLSSSNAGAGFAIGNDSYFEFYDMEYNTIDHCVICNTGGFAYGERNKIVGTAAHGFYRGIGNGDAQFFDTITIANPWTIPGANAFIRLQSTSHVSISATFVGGGNVTGKQYVIDSGTSYSGPALSTIPGTVTGTIGAGARINGAFSQPVFGLGASVVPTNNGELVIEATSNTTLTFKLKGTDAVVRSGALTLS